MCKKIINGIFIEQKNLDETFISINNIQSFTVTNDKIWYNNQIIRIEDIKYINIRYNDNSVCENLKRVIVTLIAKLNTFNAKVDIKVE